MYVEIAITVIIRFSARALIWSAIVAQVKGVYGEGPYLACRQAPARTEKKLGEVEVEDCEDFEAIGTGRDRTGCFSGLTESLLAGQCV